MHESVQLPSGMKNEKLFICIPPRYILSISLYVFSSPELIVYQSSRRLCVCLCVCRHFSNLNISATGWPIVTKFYLNLHWGGIKAALDFGPDRIGTLVSMATDSSHRVIMRKMLSEL